MRLWVAEIDQHTIAHILGDKSGEAGDRIRDTAVVVPDQLPQILGVVARRQRRRADQITEHHRQLAPLGLRPHTSLPRGRGRAREGAADGHGG